MLSKVDHIADEINNTRLQHHVQESMSTSFSNTNALQVRETYRTETFQFIASPATSSYIEIIVAVDVLGNLSHWTSSL